VDVRLPDGTVVRALSLSERKEKDPSRDYGLYFDSKWRPTWPADVVEWEDFGLPANSEVAAEQIRQAFLRAKRGERVGIGCIGGLGRTGTALASAMSRLSQPVNSPEDETAETEASAGRLHEEGKGCRAVTPVKAPFSWPKSSVSRGVSAKVPQFTAANRRGEATLTRARFHCQAQSGLLTSGRQETRIPVSRAWVTDTAAMHGGESSGIDPDAFPGYGEARCSHVCPKSADLRPEPAPRRLGPRRHPIFDWVPGGGPAPHPASGGVPAACGLLRAAGPPPANDGDDPLRGEAAMGARRPPGTQPAGWVWPGALERTGARLLRADFGHRTVGSARVPRSGARAGSARQMGGTVGKRTRKSAPTKAKPRSSWTRFVAPGAIGLAVMVGLATWLILPEKNRVSDAAQYRGGPRLAVDKDLIDFGTVKFNQRVHASFRLKNVGDQSLRLPASPPVEVLEGC